MEDQIYIITFTADDEEPKCRRCDHINTTTNICEQCGPNNWWNSYVRTTFLRIPQSRDKISEEK